MFESSATVGTHKNIYFVTINSNNIATWKLGFSQNCKWLISYFNSKLTKHLIPSATAYEIDINALTLQHLPNSYLKTLHTYNKSYTNF